MQEPNCKSYNMDLVQYHNISNNCVDSVRAFIVTSLMLTLRSIILGNGVSTLFIALKKS